MTEREAELLRRAGTGDSAAYGEIISKYQYLVYALALQVTRDRVAAQDIAQEVFITAYVALKELRSAGAFPSWLRTITRNRAIAWRRQQRRFVAIEDVEKLRHLPATAPESTADGSELDAFGAALKQSLDVVVSGGSLLSRLRGGNSMSARVVRQAPRNERFVRRAGVPAMLEPVLSRAGTQERSLHRSATTGSGTPDGQKTAGRSSAPRLDRVSLGTTGHRDGSVAPRHVPI
ncbi:MAG: RNA polymerase sigma factor [Acidobacteriota bacterium]